MSRKLLKINELKIVYEASNNPEKEKVILSAIDSIKALPIVLLEVQDE